MFSRAGSLPVVGYSFSVAGLLFPYHMGVISSLRAERALTETTPLNGASGGALAACCASTAIGEEMALAASIRVAQRCNEERAFLNLGKILRQELMQLFDENEVMLETLNERAGQVEFLWTSVPSMEPMRSSPPFPSNAELVDVLCASSHIPFYSSLIPVTNVGNGWGVDGFLSAPQTLGCQPVRGASSSVFVSPFSSVLSIPSSSSSPSTSSEALEGDAETSTSFVGNKNTISPRQEEIPFSPSDYLNLALGNPGPSEEQHAVLFALGKKCASRWLSYQQLQ